MSEVKTLATLVLGGFFDHDELGVIDIHYSMGNVEALQEQLVTSVDDVHVELVSRMDFDSAQSELTALREELAVANHEIESRISAKVGAIEALQAAEQRNAELEKDAARWNFFATIANELQAFPHSWGKMTPEKMNHMCDEAMSAAIKPTESGASE